jgi:DNA-binding MarR family transcriptional regulator
MVNPTPDPTHLSDTASPPADPMVNALRDLDEAHRRFRTACAATAGLGSTDFDAILALAQREPLTHRELATRCSLTSGATTALIDRLEHSGHAARAAHPFDRRSSLVVLTDTGHASVQRILDHYDTVLRSVSATGSPADYFAAITRALHDAATTDS